MILPEIVAAIIAGVVGFSLSKWIENRKSTSEPIIEYQVKSLTPKTFEWSTVVNEMYHDPEYKKHMEIEMIHDFGREVVERLISDDVIKIYRNPTPYGDTEIKLKLEIFHK